MASFASVGSAPKRSEVRRNRRNIAQTNDDGSQSVARGADPVWPAPPGDPLDDKDRNRWHHYAEWFYKSLQVSGQEIFYEQSDIMVAVLLCEELSRLLKPQFVGMSETWNESARQMERKPQFVKRHIVGGDLNGLTRLMTSLLVTEVDRRRAHIELELAGAGDEVETEDEKGAAVLQLMQGGKTG